MVAPRLGARLLAVAALAPVVSAARAEPYLALRAGLTCGSCHVNVTGGGARTEYGAGYGASTLPGAQGSTGALFDGSIHERVRLGADARGSFAGVFQDDGPFVSEFRLTEADLYAAFALLADRLTLYVDERVAPGGAAAREAFALVRVPKGGVYFKGGKLLLPYGLRLQDDATATRRFTGFTFDAADLGVEAGFRAGRWSSSLAVSNGTSGGAETDNGKQVTWSGEYTTTHWRLGLSGSNNDLPGPEKRTLAGLYGGGRMGPVVALAEADWIRDDDPSGVSVTGGAAHAELDWAVARGYNVRIWAGRYNPDRDVEGDLRDQVGIAAEGTVLPGLQLRALVRIVDGPTSVSGARDDQAAFEAHLYF